jgi:hypothetical protein
MMGLLLRATFLTGISWMLFGPQFLSAQMAGRQGRADELAEYARFKSKKVTVAYTWLLQADSNGVADGADRQMIQVRHFDREGHALSDSVFHWEDGAVYMVRRLRYENGWLVAATDEVLAGEKPLTNEYQYLHDQEGHLLMTILQHGQGGADSSRFFTDPAGDLIYSVNSGISTQYLPDTLFCKVNAEGRLVKSTGKGTPLKTNEYQYNDRGQLIRMDESVEYPLLGYAETTFREFEYDKHGLLRYIRDYNPDGKLQSVFSMEYRNRKGKAIR